METSTNCPLPVWVRWNSALDTPNAAVAPDSTSQTATPARVGPFAAQRRAAHVLALAALHLDDVGPEQRKLVARIGAGQHLREVENLHAFERSGQWDVLLRASLRA